MSAAMNLLARLHRHGVVTWVEGDRLRYRAPSGAIPVELRDELVQHKTEIIDFLQQATRSATPSQPAIARVPRDQPLLLSSSQQRLWFLDRLIPNSPVYNIPVSFQLSGKLDVAALEASLNAVVQRHESLRTVLMDDGAAVVQVVQPFRKTALECIDLSTHGPDLAIEHARRMTKEESVKPFDLERGPLFRAKLLRLAENEHVLLMTMHHIVSDGWSMGILTRELSSFFEAFSQGKTPATKDLPIQYPDYAAWQRQWLSGESYGRQLEFWKNQLSGLSPLPMPTDHPRPATPSYRGCMRTKTLPEALSAEIKQFNQRNNATLFMTALAAFSIVLQRYTGQDDIVVGMPIANRNRSETEDIVGFFVNTLVMRTRLDGDPTVRELLGRIREASLASYEHQDMPFEKLVEELDPQRDLSRNPLFQVMFAVQNTPRPRIRMGDLRVSTFMLEAHVAKVDLELNVWETTNGLFIGALHATDLFESATVDRLMEHLQTALRSIIENPDQRISALEVMPDRERKQVLCDWGQGERLNVGSRWVHTQFESVVAASPGAVAVVHGESALTYAELNAKANQLARHLMDAGVGPGGMVGLYLERSLDMMVAILAILKAGGAYVPLDPSYPADRVSYMLGEIKAPVILSQASLATSIPVSGARVICVDRDWSEIEPRDRSNLNRTIDPESLAYVIFTSGSTGKPKGVKIPHRAIANFLLSMRSAPGMSGDDVLVAVTTLSFDIAALELFLPLTVGARCVIASHEEASDGRALAALLTRHQATMFQATPATYQMLIASGWRGDRRLKTLCGGEAMPRELAGAILDRCGSLWNMYGPTETTVWSTIEQVRRDGGTISIGRPIANTDILILDERRRPVPIGVIGELWIGGHGLAAGYLHRPDLTEERFVNCTIPGHGEVRAYRTGDLAKWLPDGRIECLGRIDHQVKLRGFRIELGEIESVLEQHASIARAVILLAGDGGDRHLAAYITLDGAATPSFGELREHLLAQLPEYMVPTVFKILDAFPLTPNGKVDRKALPSLNASQLHAEQTYVAPTTPTQVELESIWRQLLRLGDSARIGIHDSFFDLGGHSLLAMQVVSRVRDVFEFDLPLRKFFESPTIGQLAEQIDLARWAMNSSASAAMPVDANVEEGAI